MVSHVSQATLDWVRKQSKLNYTDVVIRLIYTPTSGDYGYGRPTYPTDEPINCLFAEMPTVDAQGQTLVPGFDAMIHYPLGTVLNPADRVRLVSKRGRDVDPTRVYAITRGPVIRDSMMQAELTLITDGSI